MLDPELLCQLLMPTPLLLAGLVSAAGQDAGLRLQQVRDCVYAIVGLFGNRTPENLDNNAAFGIVVTDAGAVLVDYGGSARDARTSSRWSACCARI